MDQTDTIAGFYAPVHRALTEPILLGGAPRAVAIVNGTLAAAVGLGLRLWIVGAAIWLVSRTFRRDVRPPGQGCRPSSMVCAGTSAIPSTLSGEGGIHDEPRRIPPPLTEPRRLPALGGARA